MTRLQTLTANEWDRSATPLKEEIVRRKRGDKTHTEKILAVVQLDTAAAGSQISNGGLEQQQDRDQIERSGLVELDASQEVFAKDSYEINGELWFVIGKPIGSDVGSKTVVICNVQRQHGRQPNVNTKT